MVSQTKDDAPAVRLDGVGKSFKLARAPKPGERRFFRRRSQAEPENLFWALRDVSFTVGTGRALGILGLNGAGKSTLLNLIAGVLQPTTGTVEVNGRVQLLQLGAGFVPALSGRQNVASYARERGLSSRQIEERVAFVEEFADIGAFFDQPMQTYSSGMQARVAFGNAFAVDPEILIVDEALAVGDAVFTNKCFRRIQDIRSRGATVLFTSHSSDAVLRLCDDGLVLHKGELIAAGSARDAVKEYTSVILGHGSTHGVERENGAAVSEGFGPCVATAGASDADGSVSEAGGAMRADGIDRLRDNPLYNAEEAVYGAGGGRIVEARSTVNGHANDAHVVQRGDQLDIFVRVFSDDPIEVPNLGFIVTDHLNVSFFATNLLWKGDKEPATSAGESRLYQIGFPVNLAPGTWFITMAIADGMTVLQQRDAALRLEVVDPEHYSIGPGWLDLRFKSLAEA